MRLSPQSKAALVSSDSPRYRVLKSLGKGGMGEVVLADDTQLGRKVAIKFLAEALEADETARERLHREARSAAALDHPYICKFHELVVIDGSRGIVMEHVTGETLQARLRRASLSPKEALEIAGEVAEAMEAAHQRRQIGGRSPGGDAITAPRRYPGPGRPHQRRAVQTTGRSGAHPSHARRRGPTRPNGVRRAGATPCPRPRSGT